MHKLIYRNHCNLYSTRYNHQSFLIVPYYTLSPIQSYYLEISLTAISVIFWFHFQYQGIIIYHIKGT